MDVDLVLLEAAGRADRQHLLDQRRDAICPIQDDFAILLDALVIRMPGGEQLGGAL